MYGGELGVRRLWALVNGLPEDSATHRETWTLRDEVAAATVEIVDFWGRVGAQLQGVKPRDLPDPVRIPRPGDEERNKPKIEKDPRKIAAFFAKHH